MRIALDFHSVLCDVMASLIPRYNAKYGVAHTEKFGKLLELTDCTVWDMAQYAIGPEIYEFFSLPETHLEAPPLPDAPEVTKRLVEDGHDVIVITDSIMLPTIGTYLKTHYPHLAGRDQLWRVPNKHKSDVLNRLGFDVFVEDNATNLREFQGQKYLLAMPYNKVADYSICRVPDWRGLGWRLGVFLGEEK